ncbi:DUF5677 domain-containing protein [Psychrobium sp. 1_MG-2023]|uniref:DUF5677 domain-containing protein n=1 Tax=Psychrobium sp. 1_MG-2023 TaxID=3062624 RepID=UPI0026A6572C|nr:DUF5677 domain-containing protein [Psychrobium sp. 1_MG-2023]MDP2560878.1 DUF5677 domain-containing protein [Psychrobium sp. 1_MG-2023]
MASVEDWVGLLKIREDKLPKIKYETVQQKYVLFLASRVSELCLDAVILLNNQRVSGVPVILRTALESYADFLACIKESEHTKEMTDSLYWQLHELHKETDKEKSNYYKNKGEYSSVKKRFNKAGLQDLFNGYYKALSLHSHGNLSALIEFHSKDNSVYLGSLSDDEKLLMFFDQAINFLALILKDTFEFFKLPKSDLLEPQRVLDSINKNS